MMPVGWSSEAVRNEGKEGRGLTKGNKRERKAEVL
jgi:hypothetical protein